MTPESKKEALDWLKASLAAGGVGFDVDSTGMSVWQITPSHVLYRVVVNREDGVKIVDALSKGKGSVGILVRQVIGLIRVLGSL